MGWIMIMSQKKLAYQSRTNCDHMYHPLHLAFPASPLPSSRLCGTNQPSYTRSSVVGTTSSAVGPFTPALLPLQFLRGTGAPHRTAPHRTAPTCPAPTRTEKWARPPPFTSHYRERALLRGHTEHPRRSAVLQNPQLGVGRSHPQPGPWRREVAGWVSPGAGLSTDRCPWTCLQHGR